VSELLVCDPLPHRERVGHDERQHRVAEQERVLAVVEPELKFLQIGRQVRALASLRAADRSTPKSATGY
jgi:hypothetical protein